MFTDLQTGCFTDLMSTVCLKTFLVSQLKIKLLKCIRLHHIYIYISSPLHPSGFFNHHGLLPSIIISSLPFECLFLISFSHSKSCIILTPKEIVFFWSKVYEKTTFDKGAYGGVQTLCRYVRVMVLAMV
jgi:hypothetical protein